MDFRLNTFFKKTYYAFYWTENLVYYEFGYRAQGENIIANMNITRFSSHYLSSFSASILPDFET